MFDFNFLSAGDLHNLAGNEFRRVRLEAKGKQQKNLFYIADFELATTFGVLEIIRCLLEKRKTSP